MIYTGGKKNHPDTLNLKDCFFPIEQNVLREYLGQRESEVLDIRMYLFDQEEITKMLIQDERRKQAEETAQKMLQRGKMTVSEIAEDTGLTVVEIEELEEMMLQKA